MRRLVPLLLLGLAAVLAWILLRDTPETGPQDRETVEESAAEDPRPARLTGGDRTERAAMDEEEPFDPRAEKVGAGDFGLHGTVVDERGAPVPNAWVAAYSAPFPLLDFDMELEEILERPLELSLEPLASTRADEEGRFRLEGLYGRGNYLVARAERRLTRGRQPVKPEELDTEKGVLVHTVAGAALEGVVRDHTGAPVADAEVFVAPALMYLMQAIRKRDVFLERVFTDGSGRFRIEAVPAGAMLMAQAFDGATHPGARDFGPLPPNGSAELEVVLAETGALSGRIENDAGESARGATVIAVPLDLRLAVAFVRAVPEWTTTTGGNGRFEFARLPKRNYLLLAQGRDGRSAPLAANVGGPDSVAPEPLVLQTRREFEGRVVNAEGEGIPGARVALNSIPEKRGDEDERRGRRMGGGVPSSTEFFLEAAREILPELVPAETWAETDGRGRFTLAAWTEARLTVEAPGYREASFEIPDVEKEGGKPVFVMLKPAAIAGRVLDGETGKPARFFVVSADQRSVLGTRNAGELPTTVAAPAPPPTEEEGGEFDPFEEPRPQDAKAEAQGPLAGKLAPDEVPVFPRQASFGQLRHVEFHDDGSGEFLLADLMPGTWIVEARADGYVVAKSERLMVRGGETMPDVVLTLERGATLRGRVVAQGTREPVAGAMVTVGRGEQSNFQAYFQMGLETTALDRTEGDGSFELRGVEKGMDHIHVFGEGFAPRSVKGSPLEPGDVREDIVIEVTQGGNIQGTVVDRHGAPLPARMVVGFSIDSQDFWQAATDETGFYRVENVRPGAYFLVTAALDDEALFTGDFLSVLNGTRMKQVFLEEGQTITVDIEDLAAGGCHLRGRLVRNGRPIPNAAMFCMAADSGGIFDLRMATAGTDEEGEFEFESLAPGEYRVEVNSEDWSGSVEFEVEDVPEDYVVLDVPEGVVQGRVLAEQTGLPVEDAGVSLVRDDAPGGIMAFMPGGGNTEWSSTDEDGSFEFTGVAPGRYHVEVGQSRWAANEDDAYSAPLGRVETEPFELLADQTKVLADVRLPVAAAIEVSVRRADGEEMNQGFSISAQRTDVSDAEAVEGWGWRGNGTVSGLEPGTYEVRVQSEGFSAGVERSVAVVQGQTTEVEFVLEAGVRLLARVTDGNGQAVPDVEFQVYDSAGERVDDMDGLTGRFARAFSFDQGAIALGTYPAGSYTVVASREGTERRRSVTLGRDDDSRLVEFTF